MKEGERGRSTIAKRVLLDCQMKCAIEYIERVNILKQSKSLRDIILNVPKMHDSSKHSSLF